MKLFLYWSLSVLPGMQLTLIDKVTHYFYKIQKKIVNFSVRVSVSWYGTRCTGYVDCGIRPVELCTHVILFFLARKKFIVTRVVKQKLQVFWIGTRTSFLLLGPQRRQRVACSWKPPRSASLHPKSYLINSTNWHKLRFKKKKSINL